MHPFPHEYRASTSGGPEGNLTVSSPALPDLASDAPAAFDGPGNQWSPETLLVASVADCFVLTFRAMARASKIEWTSLDCRARGILERVDRVTRFTAFHIDAKLRVPAGTDVERARFLLEKAERGCLVTNSMTAERILHDEVMAD
jgi:organic hydroperoxide reductase OsmC/OhrA